MMARCWSELNPEERKARLAELHVFLDDLKDAKGFAACQAMIGLELLEDNIAELVRVVRSAAA